jgi:alcohol dehydrogenase class IV
MNKDTLAWLSQIGAGYKSYIAAAGFGLLALYHAIEGNTEKAAEFVTAALAVVGIRHALTATKPTEPEAEEVK